MYLGQKGVKEQKIKKSSRQTLLLHLLSDTFAVLFRLKVWRDGSPTPTPVSFLRPLFLLARPALWTSGKRGHVFSFLVPFVRQELARNAKCPAFRFPHPSRHSLSSGAIARNRLYLYVLIVFVVIRQRTQVANAPRSMLHRSDTGADYYYKEFLKRLSEFCLCFFVVFKPFSKYCALWIQRLIRVVLSVVFYFE